MNTNEKPGVVRPAPGLSEYAFRHCYPEGAGKWECTLEEFKRVVRPRMALHGWYSSRIISNGSDYVWSLNQ